MQPYWEKERKKRVTDNKRNYQFSTSEPVNIFLSLNFQPLNDKMYQIKLDD